MSSALPRLWTVEEFRALPDDGRRYELIDGQLYVNGVEVPANDLALVTDAMTPAPTWRHGTAVRDLFLILDRYLRAFGSADVRLAPGDVELTPERIVQPDIFVVPFVSGRPPRSWEEAGRLLLAVEVLSPSTARTDRTRKRRVYQESGVPEYWIIDVDARLVERWRPTDDRPDIIEGELVWAPEGIAGEGELLTISLPAYFAGVVGE